MTTTELKRAGLRFIGDNRPTYVTKIGVTEILQWDSGAKTELGRSQLDELVKPLSDPWWLGALLARASELGIGVAFGCSYDERYVSVRLAFFQAPECDVSAPGNDARALITALDQAGLIPADPVTPPPS